MLAQPCERYSLTQIVPPTAEPISPADAKQQLRIVTDAEDTLIQGYIAAATRWAETFCNRQFVLATFTASYDHFPWYWNGIDNIYGLGFKLPRAPLISVSGITYVDSAGATQTLSTSTYVVDPHVEPGNVGLAYNQYWPTVQPQRNAVTVSYTAGYGARTKTRLDLASVLAGQTIVINGLTFTAHATVTTVSTRTFSIAVSNAAAATALALCINDSTYGVPNVAATVSSARITLTPYAGTDVTATPSAATITVSTSYEATQGESVAAVPAVIKHAIRMLVAHWYEHRESVSELDLKPVPQAVESLLWSERILEF